MSTIKDIVADYALGKYKGMCNDELLDTMQDLLKVIVDDTTAEEKIALKKPYWSLVYRIANSKGLMWDKPRIRKNYKKQQTQTQSTTEDEEDKKLNKWFDEKAKKRQETKPKKEN